MNLDTSVLKQGIVHFVGNKNNAEPLQLSQAALPLDEVLAQQLTDGFLHRFKSGAETYSFAHNTSLQYHEVYNFCQAIFDDAAQFETMAANLARHLYEASTHPKIKGGEFYVTLFEGVPVESRLYKAIGLFKTENKALFLDVTDSNGNLSVNMKEGVELSKIDKGCLVINRNADKGFDVYLFDNQNRGEEALYWKETFLGLAPQQNAFHHTSHVLALTKQFITQQPEDALEKKEQVELLQKSLHYFSEKDSFDINEFQTEVFGDEAMINSFRQFGATYVESHDYDIAAQFDISAEAVKKGARVYKSVLKLDKNFHVYIHGRTDLIERGVDNDGRKYYKLYYQDES